MTIATLRLEAIGDNYARLATRDLRYVLKQRFRIPPAHFSAVLTGPRRPWVARITGRDRRGFAREFLRGLRDYRDANSVGSRGVMFTYVLKPGHLYEVRDLRSWTRERRYFCRVDDGTIVEMTTDEVAASLDSETIAISQEARL